MFEIEIFDKDKHLKILHEWWVKQGWIELPIHMLPPLGVVVKDHSDYLYAMFMYDSGSSVAWLEFFVGNPNIEPKRKRGALGFGITDISILAKKIYGDHISTVFTSSNDPAFINSLKKCDFCEGDKNITQLIKPI